MVERTFAHLCETGGARRSWLRGLDKLRKRWLLHAAARNLGLILRKMFGIGTARTLQGGGGLAARPHLTWFAMRSAVCRQLTIILRLVVPLVNHGFAAHPAVLAA